MKQSPTNQKMYSVADKPLIVEELKDMALNEVAKDHSCSQNHCPLDRKYQTIEDAELGNLIFPGVAQYYETKSPDETQESPYETVEETVPTVSERSATGSLQILREHYLKRRATTSITDAAEDAKEDSIEDAKEDIAEDAKEDIAENAKEDIAEESTETEDTADTETEDTETEVVAWESMQRRMNQILVIQIFTYFVVLCGILLTYVK